MRRVQLCVMHQDFHLFPYKTQILQHGSDKNKRLAIGQTISQRIEEHPGFLNVIFFQ